MLLDHGEFRGLSSGLRARWLSPQNLYHTLPLAWDHKRNQTRMKRSYLTQPLIKMCEASAVEIVMQRCAPENQEMTHQPLHNT